MAASGQFHGERFSTHAVVGELALDGTLRPAKGTLSMAISARNQGRRGLVVPAANAQEAAVVDGIDAIPVASLAEAVGFFSGQLDIEPVQFQRGEVVEQYGRYDIDYSDVKGQELAKRAVTVAAAGSHHLLMML